MFMPDFTHTAVEERTLDVRVANFTLEATLALPRGAAGLVVLAGGSGRHHHNTRFVAAALREGGLATLLLDLLTPAEEAMDQRHIEFRADIALLASRLTAASEWLGHFPDTRRLRLGYFADGATAAGALVAAAARPELVSAIAARAGRPDLAGPALARVRAPTLLLVGGADAPLIAANREALMALPGDKRLDLIPDASHDFEEPGALELMTQRAREWFEQYLLT